MALEIQCKLEYILMIYNDTLDKQLRSDLTKEELNRRATEIMNYHKELLNKIDELPELCNIEQNCILQQQFLEKDALIDRHNKIKKDLIQISQDLDSKIEQYIRKVIN